MFHFTVSDEPDALPGLAVWFVTGRNPAVWDRSTAGEATMLCSAMGAVRETDDQGEYNPIDVCLVHLSETGDDWLQQHKPFIFSFE